ncbi:hypothetical protein ACQP1O_22220 [Nocardia sp. CA-151230]|uniref:hypothetical protein n=1 Tax=Nocardia sp. CA-151230 TaxID=3239982 RepID=UPI003D91EB9B
MMHIIDFGATGDGKPVHTKSFIGVSFADLRDWEHCLVRLYHHVFVSSLTVDREPGRCVLVSRGPLDSEAYIEAYHVPQADPEFDEQRLEELATGWVRRPGRPAERADHPRQRRPAAERRTRLDPRHRTGGRMNYIAEFGAAVDTESPKHGVPRTRLAAAGHPLVVAAAATRASSPARCGCYWR